MDSSINIACGFLNGTIISIEGGYRVLQHPRPDKMFTRIADARWFLAVNWCEQCSTAAAILTHDGILSFLNQAALTMGEAAFVPLEHRQAVFNTCISLSPNTSTSYIIQENHCLEVLGLEIDPRYGKVAIIRLMSNEK
ncbi:MAG: hypothetical protein AB4041_19695 [Microcystaceae cyanobacterium]